MMASRSALWRAGWAVLQIRGQHTSRGGATVLASSAQEALAEPARDDAAAGPSGGMTRLQRLRAQLASEVSAGEEAAGLGGLDAFLSDGASASSAYAVPAPTPRQQKRDGLRKPDWLKFDRLPQGARTKQLKSRLRELGLATVCEEAKCPNLGECWGGGRTLTLPAAPDAGPDAAPVEVKAPATATIMLLGDTCTRACRFCAVKTSRTPPPPDPDEPSKVARAVSEWGIDYVVFTTVDRDDLPDQGASHIARTVQELKALSATKPSEEGEASEGERALAEALGGGVHVEALVGDFNGKLEDCATVACSGVDVFAHNVETVERLQGEVRDRRANWHQSLSVLRHAKEAGPPGLVTKTSLMLGLGETKEDVLGALEALRDAGVDVVTFGQYMRPTKRHIAVTEYVTPEAFQAYQTIAEEMGFLYVASGPLVRSSYRAGEYFISGILKKRQSDAMKEKEKKKMASL